MIEVLVAIIGVIGSAVVFEPIIFYRIYRKKKNAEVTDANIDNSTQLIELQSKYISLIDGKDNKINELNERILRQESELIYLRTTHCCKIKCLEREPPFGANQNKTTDENDSH